MKDPKELEVVRTEEGVLTAVMLPQYVLGDEGMEDRELLPLLFCKGTKEIPLEKRQVGVFTESIIQAGLLYLQDVNTGNLSNLDTTEAIQHLKAALECLGRRHQKRTENGTAYTNKA